MNSQWAKSAKKSFEGNSSGNKCCLCKVNYFKTCNTENFL